MFRKEYWKDAARQVRRWPIMVFAAIIVALRVSVKLLRIPMLAGLSISFDCYINALGSVVYGPIVALMVGAVSDTLGCVVAPNGPYFPPFILVEMTSSLLFALFFWKREITPGRVLAAKFTVNTVCNIGLTSVFMKWSYYVFYGIEKAEAYHVINLVRIGKNLVLFPLEALLIVLVLRLALPALKPLDVTVKFDRLKELKKKRLILEITLLTLLSVGLVLFYVFFLKDFIKAHNIKLL